MLFDRLCHEVELQERLLLEQQSLSPGDPKHMPAVNRIKDIRHALDRCRLFTFETADFEAVATLDTILEIARTKDEFFLPFPCVAGETSREVYVFWDEEKNAIGSRAVRWFIHGITFRSVLENLSEAGREDVRTKVIAEELGSGDRNPFIMTIGKFDDFYYPPGKTTETPILFIEFATDILEMCLEDHNEGGDAEIIRLDDPDSSERLFGVMLNLSAGLSLFAALNTPDRFVVEQTPVDLDKYVKKAAKTKRILRSHQRPTYTLLKPHKIRQKLELDKPKGTHASPVPHDRRAHRRLLSSEHYSEDKRGTYVAVKACWVGPKEKVIGRHKYKVRLDI